MKHKIILKNLSCLFLSFAFIASFVSCDQVESVPDDSGIVVKDIAGGWWIIGLEPDGETPAYGGDYVGFNIYNTSENNLDFWIDDHGEFFEIKSKANINLATLTFSSEVDTPELYTDETVTITNGSVTKNTYTTASNTVVDEIFFEAEFSWDPGTVYKFKGHKNTAKVEDANPHY